MAACPLAQGNLAPLDCPVGHQVTLPDGRRGVVGALDPHDPDRPTVRVPEGRAYAEVKADMTAPPAVLAEDPLRRTRLAT